MYGACREYSNISLRRGCFRYCQKEFLCLFKYVTFPILDILTLNNRQGTVGFNVHRKK